MTHPYADFRNRVRVSSWQSLVRPFTICFAKTEPSIAQRTRRKPVPNYYYDRSGPRLGCSGTPSDGDWRPGITCGGVATSLQFPSIVRTELLTPLPYRLIGHDDSALGEKILDTPEADVETMVSADHIAERSREENDSRSNETARSS